MNIIRRFKYIQLRKRLKRIRLIILDFDGVLTNNTVYVSEHGVESVSCSRSDGPGVKILRSTGLQLLVLSTETNPVVARRCSKLSLECNQGISSKSDFILREIMHTRQYAMSELLYVGNDLNDLTAMKLGMITACPSDSHYLVRRQADIILSRRGGHGVTLDLVGHLFQCNPHR